MRRDPQAGSSVVELALLAPLIVGLIFIADYLFEVAAARIKQQEIARFLSWELSSHPLSDLSGGKHASLFEKARQESIDETRRRYAGFSGHRYAPADRGFVARAVLVDEGLHLEPAGLDAAREIELPGGSNFGSFDRVIQLVGRSQRKVLEYQGFNLDHVGATASVEVVVENRFLPRRIAGVSFFPERLERLRFAPARTLLLSDSWYLADGRDVDLPGGKRGEGGLFWKQVNRIALLGLGSELSNRAGPAARVLDWFPIRVDAQLVSQRYGDLAGDRSRFPGCSSRELAQSGKWRNGEPGKDTPKDRLSKVKCFDTLPIDADKLGVGYSGDPSFRILANRGNHYMGCRSAGAPRSSECNP